MATSISVLSGKGGAGKTFVSTNLANVIDGSTYLDMDVEEPNGIKYFTQGKTKKYDVTVKSPKIDYSKCNGCRECVDECVYGGLVFISKPVLLPAICHSCTKCMYVCKTEAITMIDRVVGEVTVVTSKDTTLVEGKMNVLEISGDPIINYEKKFFSKINIIDSPPGTSCLAINSIKDSDYLLIVAESSVYGFHNFKMVVLLALELKKKFAVVINKYDGQNNLVKNYCHENKIEILDIFNFDKDIYKKNGEDELVTNYSKEYRNRFIELYQKVEARL